MSQKNANSKGKRKINAILKAYIKRNTIARKGDGFGEQGGAANRGGHWKHIELF